MKFKKVSAVLGALVIAAIAAQANAATNKYLLCHFDTAGDDFGKYILVNGNEWEGGLANIEATGDGSLGTHLEDHDSDWVYSLYIKKDSKHKDEPCENYDLD